MSKIKFLHCADVHLDSPFSSLGDNGHRASKRRHDLIEVFCDIINIAAREKVDMLFISGDLYEHEYVKKSTISIINEKFREIPDVQVFVLPGNHDPYMESSYYSHFNWSKNVTIMNASKSGIFLKETGTVLHCTGFTSFNQYNRLPDTTLHSDRQYINILLAHGTVDLNIGTNGHNPLNSEILGKMGMDYIALGHFHNRIDDVGRKGVIYNPGSPEALGFDEPGEHGVYIGTLEKHGAGASSLEMEFIKTGKRAYEVMDVNINGCENDLQVLGQLDNALSDKSDKQLYCINLKGYVDFRYKVDVRLIQEKLESKAFYIKVKDQTCPDYDFDRIKKEPGIKGIFVRKMESLILNASTEEAKNYKRALYYGMEALEKGKVEI